ncbi:MAG: UDP-N-acetylmuramoyl-L-alanine--D-glutamate ligase [Lachnospiraceae bacterium]
MELKDKRVCVVGSGLSGMGAVKLLNGVGANVCLYDGNDKLKESDLAHKLGALRADIVIGNMPREKAQEFDLAVISPGVPIDSIVVKLFDSLKVPVWGEIELAYNYEKGKVAAITGTNGKTTTTALLGQIVGAYNKETFVVGNIGNSYTGAVLATTGSSMTVAEISSFQLESTHEFHPVVTAILNITPDHLNRHYTMDNYAHTKERIAMNQTKDEVCVLNYDDEMLREYAGECPARVMFFSRLEELEEGVFMEGDEIVFKWNGRKESICDVHEMNLIGTHNYENVMAAVGMAVALNIPTEIISREVKAFKAVEHRIEFVAEKDGVVYYNDSKGTNPEASVKAIEAMTRPTILIGGGYDKKSEFDLYIKAFNGKVKLLVLIGQTRDKIAETARKYGFDNIIMAESMEEVVNICAENAVPGDAVLLSPACASWGMFENYEQRGRMFKDYVNRL